MKEVYGPVTAFVVMVVVTLIVQMVKQAASPNLSDRAKQYLALGIAILFVVPFELLTAWPDLAPIDFYNAFIYAFLAWLGSMGLYKAAQVQIGR